MRRNIIAVMTTVLTLVGSAVQAELKTIPIEEIDLEEIELSDVVVECAAGSSIPLRPFIRGEIVHLDSDGFDDLLLTVLETFYLKFDEEEILFSWEAQQWKRFSEFFTGNATLSLSSQDDQMVIELGAELHQSLK